MLWAEMMEMYRKNKKRPLKLSMETENHLKEIQKEFMPEDSKIGIIQDWLDNCNEDYVCSLMLYSKALHHEYEEPKQYELRDINSIMNNSITGWEKAPQHRFKDYGRQASWKRISDSSGFVQLPEDAQLPFD